MINLSNYHSNGLPTAVWSNKVNLIGEKVYKPKLHFCEHCNKPILIYGRLIPCKHVFCFTCATLCLTQQLNRPNSLAHSPPQPHISGDSLNHNQIASPHEPLLPPPNHHYNQSPLAYSNNDNNLNHGNNTKSHTDHYHNQRDQRRRTPTRNNKYSANSKNIDLHRSDSNHSFSSRDNNNERYQHQSSILNIDESTTNTTPTTMQQDMSIDSPSVNSGDGTPTGNKGGSGTAGKGCHRCGGKALRVERNTLNSIFVCQIETCRRTYLSARDLQAHVNHRHARSKSGHSAKNSSASLAAISSSPYISSSTLMHLNNQQSSSARNHGDHQQQSEHHNSRRHPSSSSNNNNNNHTSNHNINNSSANNHHPHHGRQDRDGPPRHARDTGERFRDRERDRDNYQRDRDRERERDGKQSLSRSMQRAAQWAEQSAQMMEKGLTR